MIKMGLHFPGEKPFSDVVIHGLIRAPDGRKMSKSLSNAIDPLDVVEEYGADALRLTLMQAAAPGQDVPFDVDLVDAARRFGNKVWNAFRFAVEHVGISGVPAVGGYPEDPGPVDAWILGRLATVAAEYDSLVDEYRFSDAVGLLYSFAWSEVFDWYLEMVKPAIRDDERAAAAGQTLGVVLRDLLKLLHPVMPYLTEELWAELVGEGMVVTASWPEPPAVSGGVGIAELQDLVVGVRRFRAEHNLGATPLQLLIDDPDGLAEPWWAEQFESLARTTATIGVPADLSGHARITAGAVQGFVPLAGLIDPAEECPRLEKAIAEQEKLLAGSEAKLANPNFRDRAPADVVAKEQAKAAEFAARLEKLRAQHAELC